MRKLENNEKPYAIATVINVKGSSSGKVGDKAIFDEKGYRIIGYVGGGCIENRASDAAIETLINGIPKIIEIDLDSDTIAMGIPCGGSMSVLVEPQMNDPVILIRGEGSIVESLCTMAKMLNFKLMYVLPQNPPPPAPGLGRACRIICAFVWVGFLL